MAAVLINLDDDIRWRLKEFAVKKRTTIKALVKEAVIDLIAKWEKDVKKKSE